MIAPLTFVSVSQAPTAVYTKLLIILQQKREKLRKTVNMEKLF